MKQIFFITMIILLVVTTATNLFAYRNGWGYGGNRNNNENNGYSSDAYINSLPVEEISEVEREALLKMREEEKLARDVYKVLYDKWGIRVFTNIQNAEQRHMDTVKILLTKYGIDDPVLDDTTGVFNNAELLKLYNQLIEKGNLSITDALTVGATIEDVDIFDLRQYKLKVDNMDILFVFSNLEKGSENHMRAFYSQLINYGVVYVAQFISQEELDAIISAVDESGRGGRGRRR